MAQKNLPLDYDIVIYSGTSYRREFRWLPDGVNPIDFTGWSAVMRIGQQRAEADVELSTDNGGLSLTNGRIVILMTPAQTALPRTSIVYYNLDLIQPDGFVRRFLRGRVSVVVDVKPK